MNPFKGPVPIICNTGKAVRTSNLHHKYYFTPYTMIVKPNTEKCTKMVYRPVRRQEKD